MEALLSYPMQSSNGAPIQIISGTIISDGKHNKGPRSGDLYVCLINNPKTALYSVMRENGIQLGRKDMDERAFLTKEDLRAKLQSLENAVIVYCDIPDESDQDQFVVKRIVYEIKKRAFRRVNVEEYRADFPTEDFFEDI
jgi:hypothetical protein